MDALLKAIGAIVVFTAIVIALCTLGAYPTKWVVNWLFTPNVIRTVFGVSAISVWQAWALNFICSWLFKSNSSSSKKD